MMRKQKLGWMSGVAMAAVAFTTMASAADLPTRKAPPAPMIPVAPPFSWTGFYIGATAGGIWGSGNTTLSAAYNNTYLGSLYIPTSLGSGSSGFEGGGEVGYNYQMGSAVIGIEDDLQWVTNSKSTTFTGASYPALGGAVTTDLSTRLNWLGTTRGRLGFATMADDRLLLYVTGGLAYGGGSASVNAVGPRGDTWYGSAGATQVGWTIGGGAEYAFTNNWTVKAEYLYYNLGTYNYTATGNTAAASNLIFHARVEPEGSIARAGINYKF
jgi:outer membrane immunogenic protein